MLIEFYIAKLFGYIGNFNLKMAKFFQNKNWWSISILFSDFSIRLNRKAIKIFKKISTNLKGGNQ